MIPGVDRGRFNRSSTPDSIDWLLQWKAVVTPDVRIDWSVDQLSSTLRSINLYMKYEPVRQSCRGCNCLCTRTMHLWHWYSHQHPSEPHWWRIRRPISTSHDPKMFGLIILGSTTIIVALLLLILVLLLLLLLLLQERHAFPTLAGSLLMSTNPNGGFLVVACESQLCVALLLPNPTAKASHLTISYPTYDSSHHS